MPPKPTIKIKNPKFPGKFLYINESDFRANLHEVWEEPKPEAAKPLPVEVPKEVPKQEEPEEKDVKLDDDVEDDDDEEPSPKPKASPRPKSKRGFSLEGD